MKKIIYSCLILSGLLASAPCFSQRSTTYIILTTVTPSDPYYSAVQALSTYRSAQVIHFRADSITDLIPTLTALAPRYVAVILKPIELNINFVQP